MNRPAFDHDHFFRPILPEPCSIKLFGLGGVGSIVARYAGVFLASLGQPARLVLVDGDTFELSNANRMIFGHHGNKAMVVRDELAPRFQDSRLSLIAVDEFVNPDNIGRLIVEGDIVLLTVDNHATRKMVCDHCARLDHVCLISGGNDGVQPSAAEGGAKRGTFGNVQIYLRGHGGDQSPSLTQFHPEIQHPKDHLPTVSCTEQIASVPQILFTNLAVASAMLNTLWLHLCDSLHYSELVFDIADARMRPVLPLQIGLPNQNPPAKRKSGKTFAPSGRGDT